MDKPVVWVLVFAAIVVLVGPLVVATMWYLTIAIAIIALLIISPAAFLMFVAVLVALSFPIAGILMLTVGGYYAMK